MLLICVFCIVNCVKSQENTASITWESIRYNFGEFTAKDGKQKHRFTFTNTGNIPLYVISVRTSCGCTSSEYSRAQVAPGKTGFVEVEYDPENRSGEFKETISVTTNAVPRVTVLRVSGNVIDN